MILEAGTQQSRLNVRKYSFSQRTVNESNKLSTDCVHVSSVNVFKNRIDKYLLTLSYFRTYIYVRSPKTVATPVRIYTYTDFAIEIWGFYQRLNDTLWYHHTRCSCDFGLQLAAILKHVYQRKKS